MLPYKILIGLETHVQLQTKSKLFCGCMTGFGEPPNTRICPVCLGLPGALPVMNRQAVDLAVKTACALHCEISTVTVWDRKNYYYPDLPKGYQTSQLDRPVGGGGYLEIPDPQEQGVQRSIGLFRVHLEEDAGKSMHDTQESFTRIDLNRAGIPLLEIVTRPDIRSPEEAYVYLNELKLLLTYLKVSDCNMQEGSLRCDANINLHIFPMPENELRDVYITPIVEIKNLNSFRAVRNALNYEAQRQYQSFLNSAQRSIQSTKPKQTRLWNEQRQETQPMRSKEESSDYRYFPEPDLLPIVITQEKVDEIKNHLEIVPSEIKRQLMTQYGLSGYDADVLIHAGHSMVRYFFSLADLSGDVKQSVNWLTQEMMRVLNERDMTIDELSCPVEKLADLIKAVNSGVIPRSHAKTVFNEMLDSGISVREIAEKLEIESISREELEKIAIKMIDENANIVGDILQGKTKAISSLIGKAKKINRNIDPAVFEQICRDMLKIHNV